MAREASPAILPAGVSSIMRRLDSFRQRVHAKRWAVDLALGFAFGVCAISCSRDWDAKREGVQGGAGVGGDGGSDGKLNGGAGVGNESGASASAGGSAGSEVGGTDVGDGGGDVGGSGAPSSFPVTGVLDDFNRTSGLGAQWFGPRITDYSIRGERLECRPCIYRFPLLWAEEFGQNQEVHATLAAFDAITSEISLVLLSQGGECADVQVVYKVREGYVSVDLCYGQFETLWKEARTLNIGDRLGGRVLPGNHIEVWVNDERIATVDASKYQPTTGFIGVVSHDDQGIPRTIAWDDFGGGEY